MWQAQAEDEQSACAQSNGRAAAAEADRADGIPPEQDELHRRGGPGQMCEQGATAGSGEGWDAEHDSSDSSDGGQGSDRRSRDSHFRRSVSLDGSSWADDLRKSNSPMGSRGSRHSLALLSREGSPMASSGNGSTWTRGGGLFAPPGKPDETSLNGHHEHADGNGQTESDRSTGACTNAWQTRVHGCTRKYTWDTHTRTHAHTHTAGRPTPMLETMLRTLMLGTSVFLEE